MSKYSLIYCDPPWSFKNKKTGGSFKSAAAQKYDVMTVEEMSRLQVPELCAPDCLMIMWWVGSQPTEAQNLIDAWGFKLNTMTGFVWVKKTTKGNPYFGMGHTTRAGAECALIAYKGKLTNLIKNRSVRSVREAPIGKHSEKPAEFRMDAEILTNNAPRLEMFARHSTPGWDVFGNQVDQSIDIKHRAKRKEIQQELTL